MLRKVITIQDLTLCLDKMDASGKIEIYQVLTSSIEEYKLFIMKCLNVLLCTSGSCSISVFCYNTPDHKLS